MEIDETKSHLPDYPLRAKIDFTLITFSLPLANQFIIVPQGKRQETLIICYFLNSWSVK